MIGLFQALKRRDGFSAGGRRFMAFRRFLFASLAGILLFLTPVPYDGNMTIVLGIITGWLTATLAPITLPVVVATITLSALAGGYYLVRKPDWEDSHPVLYAACHVTPGWFLLRAAGAVLGLAILTGTAPDIVMAPDLGPMMYRDMGAAVLYILFTAMFLMPMLTDFGFMDFIGTMVQRPFRFLFRLPGNAAVDATASFVSASSVGLMVTLRQYERNIYTAREAASIATNFSIVSIPFCLVIADVTGMAGLFFTWYLTVVGGCLICAVVMVRVPPLSGLPDDFCDPAHAAPEAAAGSGQSVFHDALSAAMVRAAGAPRAGVIVRDAWRQAVGLIANVLGTSMVIGTTTLILVRHTDIFQTISYPIFLILDAIGLAEAEIAAPAVIVGFLDMYMPAVITSGIESETTRFVLAGLAVSQIIYMSDLGVIILRSKLPLGFLQLVQIFALRTVILFPYFYVVSLLVL